jgi:hypothetical protein
MQEANNKKNKLAAAGLRGHPDFFLKYLKWTETQPAIATEAREMSIIAREPDSPVICAALPLVDEFKARGISAKVVLASLGENDPLQALTDMLCELSQTGCAGNLIRWARKPELWDAHEQMVLGTAMGWSGDCMRRAPGKRDCLDQFASDAPEIAKFGSLSFDAIWHASEPLSQTRLKFRVPKPSAAYTGQPAGDLSAYSFLRKGAGSNTAPN